MSSPDIGESKLSPREQAPLIVVMLVSTLFFWLFQWDALAFAAETGSPTPFWVLPSIWIGAVAIIPLADVLGNIKQSADEANRSRNFFQSITMICAQSVLAKLIGSGLRTIYFFVLFLFAPVAIFWLLVGSNWGDLPGVLFSAAAAQVAGFACGLAYYFVRYDLIRA